MKPTSLPVLFLLACFVANSFGQTWYDCGASFASRLVRFNTFSAFPSPAVSGSLLHIRAEVALSAPLYAGSVSMLVTFQNDTADPLLFVEGIDACNFTTQVSCPFYSSNSTLPINFDYLVPDFPSGEYTISFTVYTPGTQNVQGCVSFDITVSDPEYPLDTSFNSSYQANLIGTAINTRTNFAQRTTGDWIQVGKIGNFSTGSTFSWGSFASVIGTADIIHPYFDPTNYIWGFFAVLKETISSPSGTELLYEGNFYVGYDGPYGTYDTVDNLLLTGTLTLYATQTSSVTTGTAFSGSVYFEPELGVFPAGWFNPLNLGRLNPSYVSTDDTGQFVVTGSKEYCLSGSCGLAAEAAPSGGHNLSGRDLGLILGLILGVAFLLAVGLILGCFLYRRRRYNEEDGVFTLNRKPEYGSALVVDDIIQETKAHSGAALPILDHGGKSFPPAYLDDYPMPEYNQPRRKQRGGRRDRDASPPRRNRDRDSRVSGRGRPVRESVRSAGTRGGDYSDDESDREPNRSTHSSSRSRSPRGHSPASSRSRHSSDDSRSSGSRGGRARSASFSDSESDVSGSSRSRSRSRSSRSRSADSESVSPPPRRR